MRILVGIFLLGIFFACADLVQSKHLNRISQMEKKIDSLLTVLSEINDFKFDNEIVQSKSLMSELTMLVTSDTILETDARLIHKYANAIAQMINVQKQIKDLKQALFDQKMSIQNLKKDIQNGFGQRNAYDKNILFEHTKSKKIEIKMNEIKSEKRKTYFDVTFLNPRIRKLIQSLHLKKINA
jgi:hypothetical protein